MSALAESPALAANGLPVRLEAQQTAARSQQEVWDKVAARNKAFKAAPHTGTYREVLNLKGGESERSVAPYVSFISAKYPRDRKVIGAVAAINGRVVAADVFGDPALFRKLWPKLLKSYASEAAESASQPRTVRIVNPSEAAKFVVEAGITRNRTETGTAAARNERYDSRDARAYRLMDGSGPGRAGAAVPVHETIIRK
jgi:hypothetical protein